MRVLWIDDDSPAKPGTIDGVTVQTAKILEDAEKMLKEEPAPDWVVVDLLVPQGSWGKELYMVPGVEYLDHLRQRLKGKSRLAAYGVALTKRKRDAARKAGAEEVYEKFKVSWLGVLEQLRQISGGE